ncbi:AbrB/MazE/SpoVT family DNA-binding domain-containing protein [Marinihelvus fidelis]|uniref:AbrB/MazE/SpoVT family DNA-binding domain-containing protein n=1 Tax=Marinihelvus fidelis TaxID=2613842 RepID=A0A5N0T6H0_9GAMM|nr:AbrB/MazE/SpoVT family DNA-binding domain-containing protein [Marinihelvus fidelis]KAA9129737.1 AbrB/MazE/SpoVT family DNA-binding domain-containing protein [Marinihelvus fidelis]
MISMDEFSVTQKGQVTIPKHIRQALGIRAGSRVTFRLVDGRVELSLARAPAVPVDSGFGLLKSSQVSAVPVDFDVAALATDDPAT